MAGCEIAAVSAMTAPIGRRRTSAAICSGIGNCASRGGPLLDVPPGQGGARPAETARPGVSRRARERFSQASLRVPRARGRPGVMRARRSQAPRTSLVRSCTRRPRDDRRGALYRVWRQLLAVIHEPADEGRGRAKRTGLLVGAGSGQAEWLGWPPGRRGSPDELPMPKYGQSGPNPPYEISQPHGAYIARDGVAAADR